jgi:hypothetical protein
MHMLKMALQAAVGLTEQGTAASRDKGRARWVSAGHAVVIGGLLLAHVVDCAAGSRGKGRVREALLSVPYPHPRVAPAVNGWSARSGT